MSKIPTLTPEQRQNLVITDMRFCDIDGMPKRCTLIKIYTNVEGLVGYGEVRDAATKTYAAMCKSRILGENPCNVDKIFRRIKQFGGHSRQGGGVSGIEVALMDLAGKAYGVPCYQLLGGKFRDKIRVYCDTDVEGKHTGHDMGLALKARMEAGFTFLKMDLGIGLLIDEPGTLTAPLGFLEELKTYGKHSVNAPHGSMDYSQMTKKSYEVNTVAHPFTGIHLTEKGLDMLENYVKEVRSVIGYEIPLSIDHFGHIGVEDCIKLARRYMRKVKQRDAYEIITLGGCFHGRTFGALAATGRESLSDGFTPLPEGFKQVPANDLAALEAAITPATAAVLVEVVQGEGGIVPLPGDYLRGVEALCRKHDILFICDEVQAGLCRTGTFWAFQQHGLTPDAISMAKSLANGLPMGAMLATDEMAKGFEAGSHATTFGGGALASGVAAKCVEIMLRDKLADRAAELGKHVMDRVRAIQDKLPGTVREVRGLGLMIGIELAVDAAAVWRELIARGFICNLSHGVTLRLLPALTIDKADLDAFIDTLEDILRTAK